MRTFLPGSNGYPSAGGTSVSGAVVTLHGLLLFVKGVGKEGLVSLRPPKRKSFSVDFIRLPFVRDWVFASSALTSSRSLVAGVGSPGRFWDRDPRWGPRQVLLAITIIRFIAGLAIGRSPVQSSRPFELGRFRGLWRLSTNSGRGSCQMIHPSGLLAGWLAYGARSPVGPGFTPISRPCCQSRSSFVNEHSILLKVMLTSRLIWVKRNLSWTWLKSSTPGTLPTPS